MSWRRLLVGLAMDNMGSGIAIAGDTRSYAKRNRRAGEAMTGLANKVLQSDQNAEERR
jgi:hypothetical protein